MQIQDRACHAANRVDVAVGFVTGSTASDASKACVLDAFKVTEELLLEVSQSGQRDEFTRYLASSNGPFVDRQSTDEWVKFLLGQIKLWHGANLTQKVIETVGDQLAVWIPVKADSQQFDEAVRKLEFVCMLEPEAHATAWTQSDLEDRMQALLLCLAGIAIIASNNSTMDDREATTGISFGASLVIYNITKMVA